MSKTIVSNSYNMDILGFLNVMTSDDFYVQYYKDDYQQFYPLLSGAVKEGLNQLTKSTGRTNIAVFFTTIISSLENHNQRDLKEMLLEYDEIDRQTQKSSYYHLYSDYIQLLPNISPLIIQIITELENNGFREYWEEKKLPLIKNRCAEIAELMSRFSVTDRIRRYKDLPSDDITMYISAFSNPHATMLCQNIILTDYIYSDKIIVNNFIHELFHPPYNNDEAADIIADLADMEFVKKAFKNQNPQIAYDPIEMFIEECIVEALAIYVASTIGYEDNPYEYFEKHDEGSHVISPHLYTFLKQDDLKDGQSFIEYLKDFIEYLNNQIR